jgi:hypothetical protein
VPDWQHAVAILSFKVDQLFKLLIPLLIQFLHDFHRGPQLVVLLPFLVLFRFEEARVTDTLLCSLDEIRKEEQHTSRGSAEQGTSLASGDDQMNETAINVTDKEWWCVVRAL